MLLTLHPISFAPTRRRRNRKAAAMTDDNRQTLPPPPLETPTNPVASEGPIATVRPVPDKYDTSFLKQNDSVFSEAVRIVATAARAIEEEREERREYEMNERETKRMLREQQTEILEAIQQADRNNTANYDMLASGLRLLKQSDVSQDTKISQLEKLPGTLEKAVADLKQELRDAIPGILHEALKPYIVRLEELEAEAARRR